MSKSAMVEEDSSWAQTFVTVTPQDDGFLREIENTSVVSGNSDVPLNLDTWNIVLRRSLTSANNDFVNPREFEKSERLSTHCQTYLQGVPRVELPLVYRDEATQTLYIGKDEQVTFERPFDDIITVMNDKSLPEWKKSQYVQTAIACPGKSFMYLRELRTDPKEADLKKIDYSTDKLAVMESSDLVNFLIDRTLWMCEAVSLSEIVKKDAEVQTVIKYNHATKILMLDREVQTSLSCEPKYSNSMLLEEYNATKNFCKKRVEECVDSVEVVCSLCTSPVCSIMVDAVPEDTVKRSPEQAYYAMRQKVIRNEKTRRDEEITLLSPKKSPSINNVQRRAESASSSGLKSRRKENISLADNPFYVAEDTVKRSEGQVYCPPKQRVEKIEKTRRDEEITLSIPDKSPSINRVQRREASSSGLKPRRTEDILLADNPSYVVRNHDAYLPVSILESSFFPPSPIPKTSTSDISSSSLDKSQKTMSWRDHPKISAESVDNLPPRDEEALNVFKNTFSRVGTRWKSRTKMFSKEQLKTRHVMHESIQLHSGNEDRRASPPRFVEFSNIVDE